MYREILHFISCFLVLLLYCVIFFMKERPLNYTYEKAQSAIHFPDLIPLALLNQSYVV